MSTVADLVVARTGDDRPGLLFEGRAFAWGEVARACAGRAALLRAQHGDGPFHVGVLLDNIPEYVFVLGGAALAGATVVGVNPTRRGDELAVDIRHADCEWIVTEERHAPLLRGLDLGRATGRVVTVESDAWRALVAAHDGAALPAALPAEDALWVLVFTSGSTGAPKAVRGTQGRYAGFAASMPFTADDVLYCPMPLFHGNALASNFVPGLGAGATIAMRRRFSASEFLADLRSSGATFFNTVGRALSYVLATPPTAYDRDHHVKFALAPESSPADAKAFRERFGIPIVQGYGQSEGAIVISPARGVQPGALGLPAPGQDVVVVSPDTGMECARASFDDDGRLLNAGDAIGEIVRRDADFRFEGYYNNDEANALRSRNGWYWSGDLGYRDELGVFYFAGRSTDWIRVDSENFAAAPVERILGRFPDVRAVAVFGVPDPVTGDQVMAVLELHDGCTFDPARFADFLVAQRDLGTKWSPRFVRVVHALPSTGADKIDKKPLRASAWCTDDDVWWRLSSDAPYRRLTAADADTLADAFRRNGRASFLPAG